MTKNYRDPYRLQAELVKYWVSKTITSRKPLTPKKMNEIKKEAEEAGDMHSKGCCVNTKYGCDSITKNYECCDNMKFIGGLVDKTSLTQKKKDAEIVRSELVAAGKQAKYASESLANDAHISGYVAACEVIYKAILNPQDDENTTH